MFEAYSPLVQARLRGPAFPLDAGSDSMRFLWLGDPGADGETPLLSADHDDSTILGVEFPSFAAWVADALGGLAQTSAVRREGK